MDRQTEEQAARDAAMYERIKEHIESPYKCSVIGVGADEEKKKPGFSYTVGLRMIGLPDIIVFALNPFVARQILNSVIAAWRNEPHLAESLATLDDVANLPMAFVKLSVDEAEHHMAVTRWYYSIVEGARVRLDNCVQMVWSDQKGKFPWSPGFNDKLVGLQSQLVDLSKRPSHFN